MTLLLTLITAVRKQHKPNVQTAIREEERNKKKPSKAPQGKYRISMFMEKKLLSSILYVNISETLESIYSKRIPMGFLVGFEVSCLLRHDEDFDLPPITPNMILQILCSCNPFIGPNQITYLLETFHALISFLLI